MGQKVYNHRIYYDNVEDVLQGVIIGLSVISITFLIYNFPSKPKLQNENLDSNFYIKEGTVLEVSNMNGDKSSIIFDINNDGQFNDKDDLVYFVSPNDNEPSLAIKKGGKVIYLENNKKERTEFHNNLIQTMTFAQREEFYNAENQTRVNRKDVLAIEDKNGNFIEVNKPSEIYKDSDINASDHSNLQKLDYLLEKTYFPDTGEKRKLNLNKIEDSILSHSR